MCGFCAQGSGPGPGRDAARDLSGSHQYAARSALSKLASRNQRPLRSGRGVEEEEGWKFCGGSETGERLPAPAVE